MYYPLKTFAFLHRPGNSFYASSNESGSTLEKQGICAHQYFQSNKSMIYCVGEISFVCRGKDWDGRISTENKEWAEGFDIPQDKTAWNSASYRRFVVGNEEDYISS